MASTIQLVDTHCHIHFPNFELPEQEVIAAANQAGVTRLMAVGCTLEDSKLAIKLAARYDHIWASIGLHPHEGKEYVNDDVALQEFHALAGKPKVVAIGETGLDFYYNHSSKEDQIKLLRFQLTVAQEHNLPVIFHVRDAFEEFWPVYDEFKPKGVIHCFSAGAKELDQILSRGLYVGLNGIMTFTKNAEQLEAAKAIPLQKLVLETDAPFLTPTPYRGTICEPKHVAVTAKFLSNLRSESLEELARVTTANAVGLFNLR
jgi:TatD DNase family protein